MRWRQLTSWKRWGWHQRQNYPWGEASFVFIYGMWWGDCSCLRYIWMIWGMIYFMWRGRQLNSRHCCLEFPEVIPLEPVDVPVGSRMCCGYFQYGHWGSRSVGFLKCNWLKAEILLSYGCTTSPIFLCQLVVVKPLVQMLLLSLECYHNLDAFGQKGIHGVL